MKRSTERILTTHVGSLPRPPDLWDMLVAKHQGALADNSGFESRLREAAQEAVQRQVEIGLDVITDGEMPKSTWSGYIRDRLTGFEPRPVEETNRGILPPSGATPGRDEGAFPTYFANNIGWLWRPRVAESVRYECIGPITYKGHNQVQRDIANLKQAAAGLPVEELFMAAVGPDNVGYAPGQNHYYANEADYIQANAEALREEYRAIVDAGLILQIDTPVQKYNSLNLSLEEFRRRFSLVVDILNGVLEGLPREQIRIHICYGGTHHPHTGDVELRDIIDIVLRLKASGLSMDQNVRHEHEWKMWKDVKLPGGWVLLPGLVAHTTDVVEHPELVADRIVRLANVVGRENVIASTDCGLGGRVWHEISWAKLATLVEGARIASKELWG